jgi:glutathione S-transferase
MAIEITDTKFTYVPIREAREMSGLRIVLGEFAIPGPWHEACKGVFHVKGLDYTRVRSANEGASDAQIGMDGTQSELIAWTGQSSAPVVVYDDERPRSLWNDQLYLAERLQPEPPLIPDDPQDRVTMFGLANELLGENGLVYSKRHTMVAGPLSVLPSGSPERAFWEFLGAKYGYSEAAAAAANARICSILELVGEQLGAQQARGRRYLVGDRLSAVDIYWATSCGFLDPMPPDRCPMFDAFRGPYGNDDPGIAAALTPALLAHRDFIYDNHLELPIVF